ncbi:MAG: NAD(P)/FAD-dependent oxidoreductase [Dehalococcoidia bacterium]|nr:NAD(P)/FAD-dependent oxidoreductase [Dehalococcoidia bacterium]
MADETFDAVIVGGGNKALFLAMYLVKYAGMSVGIFERRHEIGGCLATEEIAAPGFRGNTHATIQLPFYYLPLWRDFPEFWDYGAKIDQHLCSDGAVFRKDQTCLAIYSEKYDMNQERTAQEIARFSERDAEKWLRLRKMWLSREFQHVQMDYFYVPAEEKVDPKVLGRQIAVYPLLVEVGAGVDPDSLVLASPHTRNVKELWESPEVQYCNLRFVLSGAIDPTQPGQGQWTFGLAAMSPSISFCPGGTHQVAHAAHKILVRDGAKFFLGVEVEKVLIENGEARGIRLIDGTEVKANKLVVSTLNPQQLIFDLIGRENVEEKLARRIELLETSFGCLMWYTFALHEAPKYEAAAFNPDIDDTFWLGLAEDPDPDHIARETHYSRLGMFPPLEDFCPTVWCHSLADPSYAPPGKHTANNEQVAPPASAFTEREWLDIKKKYAEDLLTVWQRHAPNMTGDNIIGIDYNTPYDCLRMKNLAPDGVMALLDRVTHQIEDKRPTPELANHRTPIKNLYATGAAWHLGANSGATESYNCYKIIAKDMNLPGPWQEPGKEEPESLYQQWLMILKKLEESGKVAKKELRL